MFHRIYLAHQLRPPGRQENPGHSPGTHYVKLKEVPEAWGAVYAHQDAVLHGGAEAHGQAVRARAGPVIGRPGVQDEASTLPKDVRGASCESKDRGSRQDPAVRTASCGFTAETLHRQLWRETAATCQYVVTKRDGIQSGCHPELKTQAK